MNCTMKRTLTSVLSLSPLLTAAVAQAEVPVARAESPAFGVAAKLGGGFAQAFGDLGGTFVGELELAYAPRWPAPLGRDLAFTLSGRYSAPELAARTAPDARLPGGAGASYGIVQRQAAVGVGLLYKLPLGTAWLRPTVAAGARTYLQRTELSSRVAGEPMGAWDETSTTLGWFGALGAEAQAGPGAVVVEAVAGSAALDGAIFEGAQSGSIDLLAGYRLAL